MCNIILACYFNSIYIIWIISGYEDYIFQVISNVHVPRSKFAGKLDKISGKSEKFKTPWGWWGWIFPTLPRCSVFPSFPTLKKSFVFKIKTLYQKNMFISITKKSCNSKTEKCKGINYESKGSNAGRSWNVWISKKYGEKHILSSAAFLFRPSEIVTFCMTIVNWDLLLQGIHKQMNAC